MARDKTVVWNTLLDFYSKKLKNMLKRNNINLKVSIFEVHLTPATTYLKLRLMQMRQY
jgi:hypothetical protein